MLREYQKEDLSEMREWVNDPEIVDNLSDIFIHPHTLNETENYLNSILERKLEKEEHFVIAEKQTGNYMGQIGLINIDTRNRVAEIGIVIGKKQLMGKGIGMQALRLIQRYAFDSLNLNRLELRVYACNTRAYRCYVKSGFQEEGKLRERFYIHGRYEDVILLGMLKKDYEELKN
ncbi:GNAT family N-acetyltransferase [Candidatus Formimonas warabiya]|nr:GNAT family protein [Candidatus Formimonas warabiya]